MDTGVIGLLVVDIRVGTTTLSSAPLDVSSRGLSPVIPREDVDRLTVMQRAFRSSGGLVEGDSLSILLREHSDQPISLLARWIVNREIVSFEFGAQRWIPVFQLEPNFFRVGSSTRQVIDELRDVFDEWDLCAWFATPNAWLDNDSPAHAITANAQGVLDAARADRFVAVGY